MFFSPEKSGQHELVYQETSSHKRDIFTKILEPNAFERPWTLINRVRPDGSKYKAECVARVKGLAACPGRLEALVHLPCCPARPAHHGHEVRSLLQLHLRQRQVPCLQEFLNVEQLGRLRPFPILRDFKLQGGFALTLAACSVRKFISPEFGGRYSPLLDVSRSSCCARDISWDGGCRGGHLSSPGPTICASASPPPN